MTRLTKNHIDAEVTECVMLTRQGEPCGKPGEAGLPAGICAEHAVAVFRAVSKLVELQGGAS
ncbi:MAG TPA: hypothetical protein VGX25_35305 [Actinophytocola sp.]|uniref:hypothetical protein n=1 Tax=Actinophytocola sp. TaxID=1872138 RepID=UPI002DDD835E|nr:hypothetical protein [Actinophytocola sp.]HEV2784682.1 hypothetical protein [Actinophytocola sp.]